MTARKSSSRRYQAGPPDPEPGPAYYVVGGILIALIAWAVLAFAIPYFGIIPIDYRP